LIPYEKEKRLTFGFSQKREDEYREASLNSDIKQSKIGILLFLLPAVAFIYNDFQFFGFSDELYGILALRAGFMTYCIAEIIYLNRVRDHHAYDRSILVWTILAVSIASIVDATRPGNFIAHAIFITIFVFIIYLVIPTKFVNQIIMSAMLTVGEFLIVIFGAQTNIMSFYTLSFSLILANIIAVSSSWQIHSHRRQGFRAEEALRESSSKFRALFSSSNEGMALHEMVRDADGKAVDYRVLDVNPAFVRTTNLSKAEAIGALASELYGTGEPPYLETFERVVKTRESIAFDTYFVPMNKHLRISVFSPVEGQFATVFVDITALKDLESQLKHRAEELARSNAELQQFAYIASHDLQEPLRMMVSYLSLLEKRHKNVLDPQAEEYLRNALAGGARMRQLIDDLLEYSRVDAMGKVAAPVNMNQVLESTLEVLTVAINESMADIFVGPLPTIMAEGTQMQQLMQNLVANAIKFHGRDRPMVRITAEPGKENWTFSVKDNGIGLNLEYSDKIFQMFQRLHNQGEYSGTGVGLAISKKIVERHGGHIWVESEEGKGAAFFFTIPNAVKS
jgi:signal transduction histidine kinase